ncbi:MAG TPA: hypothetical protein VF607_13865, partial [Verrucomicrobiae bacterium]
MGNAGQGNAAYRPNPPGLETEGAADQPRLAVTGNAPDYDVGFNNGGNWANYTRSYPAGNYYCYLRAANGIGGLSDSASLAWISSGTGTSNQVVARLGTFAVPGTGDWQTYTWVPLVDSGGNRVVLTNTGVAKTLRLTTDGGNYNANFYLLAPVQAKAPVVALQPLSLPGNLGFNFATLPGFQYQVEYKTNLTAPAWLPWGGLINGTGYPQPFTNPLPAPVFYRVSVQ